MNGRGRALEDLIACLSGGTRRPRDWRALVALASETLTIGSLADAVLPGPAAGEIPVHIKELLIEVRDRARRRNLRLKEQLFELLPALNAAGIEPILMRGMARLLSSADEESRLLADIDLLVPEHRIDDCTRALGKLDYGVFRAGEEEHVPTVFCRSRDVGMVDVHAEIQPLYLQLGYNRLEPHCRSTEFPTGRALVPSPTCQLLFTIVHDQLHDGDYWRGLIDIRHLIDMKRIAAEGVDWATLAGFFPGGSPKNALFVQLRTARSLMKIDVPQEYCGGAWSALQQIRRRAQAHVTPLRPIFTLLTMAVDPPPRSKSMIPTSRGTSETVGETARRRLEHYFGPANPGKLLLK